MTNVPFAPIGLIIGVFIVFYLLFRFFIIKKAAKKDFKRLLTWIGKSGDSITQEELILEMAASYEKAGKKDKAIKHYELYLYKKKENDPEILFRIGNLYGMESFDKALEYWQKSARLGHEESKEVLKTLRNDNQ